MHAGLVAVALAAGVGIGWLLPRPGVELAGALDAPPSTAPTTDPAALAAAATDRAQRLRFAEARVRELEGELATAIAANDAAREAANADTAVSDGKPTTSDDDVAEKKKAAWVAAKGKGQGSSTEPPKGMSRPEWDDAVRVIVDSHDWRGSLSALRRLGAAKQAGQPMEAADLERWESMQQTWRELGELGVGRDDPRVLRATVPAWASALGADLNDTQQTQLGQVVEDIATREAARPTPELPERFALGTARQLRNVIALEEQMGLLLGPEQMQSYLAEVGNDPFASGWQTKPWSTVLPGASADAVAERALGHWSNHYDVTEPGQRAVLAGEAGAFAAAALAISGPPAGIDAASRRRAILERTARIAELQGEAEHRFLTAGLGLTGQALAEALERQVPLFLVPGQ